MPAPATNAALERSRDWLLGGFASLMVVVAGLALLVLKGGLPSGMSSAEERDNQWVNAS